MEVGGGGGGANKVRHIFVYPEYYCRFRQTQNSNTCIGRQTTGV